LLTIMALGLLSWLLLLMAAEAHAPLHSWLHGGTIPQDDDCAVALLDTGKVTLSKVATTVLPVLAIVAALNELFALPFVPRLPLPPTRGPPFFFSHLP
jgi:hypothetical protein